MKEHLLNPPAKASINRRQFLGRSSVVAATGLVGLSLGASLTFADALTKAQRDSMTPDDIIAMMKRGNERFRSGARADRNFLREQQASAAGQFPAAAILSCIDSRAPAEIVMDLGIGDVFNSRVAGNISNDDILGSLEFACAVAGAKVALVMGHTACGAIKGAIDNVHLGNLTGLLAKIRPAVAATQFTGERTAKNYAFVDAVARKNVELTLAEIRAKSSVLRDVEAKGKLKLVGAMYDLETAVVDFFG
ncbi:MAG TPA: carbonic anhydrase family protein [Verrucomicrobiota bacterium]|nr:carbonic anhydrase [Verrucomicrobiales bacterium]HRI12206.1 carbonic anhydrase family protein [Verrucomicrobiota bacterium]